MRNLQTEYNSLKETCYDQGKSPLFDTPSQNLYLITCVSLIKLLSGFDTAVFNATLSTTTSIILSRLDKTELQDIVCFLCSVEKTKGDPYFKQSVSMTKMRERIAKVQPVWTKCFTPPAEEEEGSAMNSTE